MTSAAHEGTGIRWDNASCYRCGDGSLATSQTDGRTNTNALLAFNATGFNAAAHCESLNAIEAHGYDDWYLPAGGPNGSSSEINLIWLMVQAEGTVGGLTAGTSNWYWSSTEFHPDIAIMQRFNNGYQGALSKTNNFLVRCVRRASSAPPTDTTDPVWTTAAGTVDTIVTGASLSTTVVATDDSGTVTYSKASGDAWISVNATTGELTGTAPGSAGTSSITVTATDPSGNTTDRTFNVTVIAVKYVFVTSTTYNGNIGGAAGADSACMTRASAAGLGGTYKAWLATSATQDPESTFTRATVPYVLFNGTTIASNWADLTDGTISNSINMNEFGASVAGTEMVRTNTNDDGTMFLTSMTCSAGTSSGSSAQSLHSLVGDTGPDWSAGYLNYCDGSLRLYCFEQ